MEPVTVVTVGVLGLAAAAAASSSESKTRISLKEAIDRADSKEELEDHVAHADCPECGGEIEKSLGKKALRSVMTMGALNAVCPGCGFSGLIELGDWWLIR